MIIEIEDMEVDEVAPSESKTAITFEGIMASHAEEESSPVQVEEEIDLDSTQDSEGEEDEEESEGEEESEEEDESKEEEKEPEDKEEEDEEDSKELSSKEIKKALTAAGFKVSDSGKIQVKVDGVMRAYTPQEATSIIASGAHNLGRLEEFRNKMNELKAQEEAFMRKAKHFEPVWKSLKESNVEDGFFRIAAMSGVQPEKAVDALHGWAVERIESLMGWQKGSLSQAMSQRPEARLMREREKFELQKKNLPTPEAFRDEEPPALDQKQVAEQEIRRLQEEYGFTKGDLQEAGRTAIEKFGDGVSLDQYREVLFMQDIIKRIDKFTEVLEPDNIGNAKFYAAVAKKFEANTGLPDDSQIVTAVKATLKEKKENALKTASTSLSKKAQLQGQVAKGKPRQESSKPITFADIIRSEQ